MNAAALFCLSAAFVWTLVRDAGVHPADWDITVLVVAVLTAVLHVRPCAPPPDRALAWPLLLLPAWVLFQLLPLPAGALAFLSPTRAALHPSAGPLSVAPALTLAAWMRLAGAILVFLTVRELAFRIAPRRSPWLLVLPLVAVALLEALLGLAQFYSAASGAQAMARGTYVNRDHFAGLMEMALPFPVMYGIHVLRLKRSHLESPLGPALIASGAFAVAALLLLASIHSLSRMGFIAALFALAVLAAAALPRRARLIAAPVVFVALFIYLPPNQLIARFASLSTPDQIAAQDRLEIWRQTLPLVAAYPATGCGLGAYVSAFMPFKRSTPLHTDNAAHNDYLQYLAELGIPGFALGLVLAVRILAAAARRHRTSLRPLALACLASLAALLLHSLVDFNSTIPANAFALAWISGIAAGLPAVRRRPGYASRITIDSHAVR